MGGSSKSSSHSSTTTNYYDERITGAEGSHIANATINGDGNNVQITDGGAVKDSLAFANNGLNFAGNAVEAALTFSLASQNNALEVLEKQGSEQLNFVTTAYNSALAAQKSADERLISDIMPYLIGGVSLIALMALTRGK